ncbi:MAG: hypothetical protein MUE53_04970 [Chitinophagales bacterium]|jgi:hypothetical protein|nr:hypothetical protein [Chitinophagales bacterium]
MVTYLKQWNFFRYFRLALSLAMLAQGLYAQDKIMIGFGVLYLLHTLFFKGCSGNSCDI